jgi:hypothetical protein
MDNIRDVIGRLYRGEIDSERAAVEIADVESVESLAEFIVDAHRRGWITNFNLGLNEDGNPS